MDKDILGMWTSPESEELWIGEVRKRGGCGCGGGGGLRP